MGYHYGVAYSVTVDSLADDMGTNNAEFTY